MDSQDCIECEDCGREYDESRIVGCCESGNCDKENVCDKCARFNSDDQWFCSMCHYISVENGEWEDNECYGSDSDDE